jgi:hypothetical protein
MFFETRDAQATRALLNVALKKTASHQIDARGVARSAPAAMAAEAARGVETRARKRKRDIEAAQLGVSIPDLPFDVVVIHVLQEKHLPDPADLAVLRAVSKGMRDAVDATGRKIEVVDELQAVGRGYLTTLKSLRRRGSLKNESLVCAAAARSGDLEELKALQESKFPWDQWTCRARGGARPPRGAAVGAREWLPVGRDDEQVCGFRWPTGGAEVAARERLPVGRGDMRVCGALAASSRY